MIELVLPNGGSAWTATFLDLLSRAGVEPNTTRQALVRSATAGWLIRERVGRLTRWHLTAEASDLLATDAERIHHFTARQDQWDGRWIMVVARAAETPRAARHIVHTRLASSGFGVASPGVWLSTHADRLDIALGALSAAGLNSEAMVFTGHFAAGQELSSLVSRAWDLGALGDEYTRFLVDFSARATDDPLLRLVELVTAWRRFPWSDPALPDTLLPESWPGTDAANLFAARYSQWSADAQRIWADIATGPVATHLT